MREEGKIDVSGHELTGGILKPQGYADEERYHEKEIPARLQNG